MSTRAGSQLRPWNGNRLLLIEQDDDWPEAGFGAATHLPKSIRDEVAQRAAAAGAPVLLIRRPARHTSSLCLLRSWCVIDLRAPGRQRIVWGPWAYPGELLSAVDELELTAAPADGATELAAVGTSEPGAEEPLALVCCLPGQTRRLPTPLTRRWPGQVWACTGSRRALEAAGLSAGEVLVLPGARVYASLIADVLSAIIE